MFISQDKVASREEGCEDLGEKMIVDLKHLNMYLKMCPALF